MLQLRLNLEDDTKFIFEKKKSKTIFSRSQIAFKISLMKEVNYITVLCKCSQHENKRSQMEQSIKTF